MLFGSCEGGLVSFVFLEQTHLTRLDFVQG